jgi:molecular chaperone DnaK
MEAMETNETILGIDLGTTNSVVSILRDGVPEVLREGDDPILPSVVGLDADGKLIVGQAARNQELLSPDRTVRSIKRRMGTDAKVRLGETEYSPQEISAMILRTLKEQAQRQLGEAVVKAVITVPAFFNEVQREATRQAGELAGLEVVRIVNEPTAAALCYDPDSETRERLLVYDLGGGTFDVSVVQIEAGVVEVLASHGDTQLGGDDFDQLLLDHVSETFQSQHEIDLRATAVTRSRTLRAVETAKKALSFEPVVRIEEEFIAEKNGVPLHIDLELERHDFENLIEPLLAKTLVCVDEALADAKIKAADIDKVVLVGGSTRTPLVHEMLKGQLGQPLHSEIDPDLCVSMGAAIQGGLVTGADVGQVLVDITPHTLGIQTLGSLLGVRSSYCYSPIIERNTALPASRAEVYVTAVDRQEVVAIRVFQGEHADVRHNQSIGHFSIEGLAEVARGNEVIVRFNLDLDGILKVCAVERATGLEKQLTIENAIRERDTADHDAAQERVDEAFAAGDSQLASAGAAPPTPATADAEFVPPAETSPTPLTDGSPLNANVQELIDKIERIAEDANPEDVEEVHGLVAKLRDEAANGRMEEAEATIAQLENMVFYMQDTV